MSRDICVCLDFLQEHHKEQIRAAAESLGFAVRFFTPEEQDYVFEQPDRIQDRFYRVWTGKESYLKYLGTGLRKSLDSFSVLSPDIARMLRGWYLPDGCCVSLCTADQDSILEPEERFFS